MNLKKYDNKLLKIIDTNNKVFEGYSLFNSKEYNFHEYGVNEDSIQILDYIFYKSNIKKVDIIKEKEFNKSYSQIELTALEEGLDSVNELLDSDNINRMINCINDNYDNLDNNYKKKLDKLLHSINKKTN